MSDLAVSDRPGRRARRRRMTMLALAAALGGVWLLRDEAGCGSREALPDHLRRLTATHGVVIGTGPPDTFFAPPFSVADARLPGVEAEPVDPASAAIALDGIERALRQYPQGFVASLIKAIFVAGELRVGSVRAGGTLGPAWILLAAPARLGSEGILATSYLGVHHELSSFVLRKEPSTLAAWERFAPAGWRFETHPPGVVARGLDADPDPKTGFLSAYGSTNLENDFNVYAEKIFAEPAAVMELARAHALVREKMRFVTAAYARIDPRLQAAFRDLGIE